MVILVRKVNIRIRAILLVALLVLAVQSALTFSRGGLYNAVGAALFAGAFSLRDPQTRARMMMLVPILVLVVNYAVLPQLDTLTKGALSTRFKSVDTTNRADIVLAQLEVWQNHPFLGVGPGESRRFAGGLAHTEISRLVAEHGLLGFVALVLLLFSAARNLRRARAGNEKAVVAATVGWSLLFMLNAGMRLAAPSFLFGLSFLTLSTEDNQRSNRGRLMRRPLRDLRRPPTDRLLPLTPDRSELSHRRSQSEPAGRSSVFDTDAG